MSVILSKDEQLIDSQDFTTNLVLSWLKTSFSLTSKRVVGFERNTLFGIIPFGNKEVTYPLKNVASVGGSTKFYLARFLVGLILVFIGFGSLDQSFIGGLFWIVVGALPLLNSYTSQITITNNAGHSHNISMSILEKDKASSFINKVNLSIAEAI